MFPINLTRTAGIEDDQWIAICDAVDRLNRAVEVNDLPAIVGGCKDLCECVAKVVLVARTEADEGLGYPALISKALVSLGRKPGEGDAADRPMREVVQGASRIASSLAEMRNRVGTGHGRATPPSADGEHALLALNASRLWCEWALARLAVVLENSVDTLINDLRGANFYRGQLAQRLSAIGLDNLSASDAERLGRAVAQRGGQGGTFVVKQDGVQAALRNPVGVPKAYRTGLVNGLFFDHNGYLNATPNRVKEAAQLLQTLDDSQAMLLLSESVARTDLAYGFDMAYAPEIVAAINAEAVRFAAGPDRDAWLLLGDRFHLVNDAD